MLELRKEMELQDFIDEYGYELQSFAIEAVEIIFDALCEYPLAADNTVDAVRDYLNYDVQIMSLKDVINDYDDVLEIDDLEEDELIEEVMFFLDWNTFLLGTYEEDDELFFIFNTF